MVLNTSRGVLAEFLVAMALGIDVTQPRVGWATWDLDWMESPDHSVAIEVKSAAYLQSWGQKALSTIQFVVPKRRGFDGAAGETEATPSRHADVYVFALLAHKEKPTLNPLHLEQWHFYVLPTDVLDSRTRSQHSITLKSLEDLAGAHVGFSSLAASVRRAAAEQLGRSG